MFACLLLPTFRLQAALRWREAHGSAALAEGAAAKSFLSEVNAEARLRGIVPGMTPAQAMARDRSVQILNPVPAQEQCLRELLLETVRSLSPEVENGHAGTVIADLRRAARAQCWQQLSERLVEQLAAQKLLAQMAVAPTPDLAQLAAEGARPAAVIYDGSAFITQLPLEALKPSEPLLTILRDWGISNVGEFLKLPRESLVERLGPEARELFNRVLLRRTRPLRLVRTEPVYAETFDFEHEIENSEPLLFLLRRFLESLSARLRAVFRVADQLTLHLPMEKGPVHERTFAIPAPTADVETLYRVLATYLETLQLTQRPIGVGLTLRPIRPEKSQFQLFETAVRDPNRFGETLARLKALLGNECVGFPVAEDTHQPDQFRVRETFGENAREETPARGLPLRRYRPAIAARVELIQGTPALLESPLVSGAIGNASGPFRLSGDWWDRRRWETEEWDIALADGGLYRLSRQRREWRIEGCYEVCGTPRAKRL